jgi:hypothetical protein
VVISPSKIATEPLWAAQCVFDLLVSNIEQKGGWLQSTSTNTGNIAIKDMDILVGGGLPVRLGQPASNWLVGGLLLSYLFEQ